MLATESQQRRLGRQKSADRRRHCMRFQIWNPAFVANVAITEAQPLAKLVGIRSKAQKVILGTHGDHVRRKHRPESRLVISSLINALNNPTHWGRYPNNGDVYTIVGRSLKGKRMLVGIKFVPQNRADSGDDEAWITTAYFIDEKVLRRKCVKDDLHAI